MSLTVCLGTCSLRKTKAGAYLWMFINWALGLRDLGCRVIWLTTVFPEKSNDEIEADLAELQSALAPFGLANQVAVVSQTGADLPALPAGLSAETAANVDLFLNLAYLPAAVVRRFRRSAFVDIDPGLTQTWIHAGELDIATHDVYFTYGETVGQHDSAITDCGLRWHHTRPPVHLPAWPITPAAADRPYTTVSGWWGEWIKVGDQILDNSKRSAFLEILDLPARTGAQLELALPDPNGKEDENDRRLLKQQGWRIRIAAASSATPELHRSYVQQSRGEFTCMKPGYALLQTAWTSERTLNYLASGKPAIIQHTGKSRFLPDAEGLFRFRNLDEAARHLAAAEQDYGRHCCAARALVEEYFDARKVVARVLERALV